MRFQKAGTNELAQAGGTSTSVTIEGLENGVEYEVWVGVGNIHGSAIDRDDAGHAKPAHCYACSAHSHSHSYSHADAHTYAVRAGLVRPLRRATCR